VIWLSVAGWRDGQDVAEYETLPEEFRRERDPFHEARYTVFFAIGQERLKVKPGIDEMTLGGT